tara:strand:- start:776 stop:1912 length:1137 start_codon:yes stop_codon:yes gene_type:complete
MKKSWDVKTELLVNFKIEMSRSVFSVDNKSILEFGNNTPGSRRLVLVDAEVFRHKSDLIKNYFNHHQIEAKIIPIEISEEEKNLENLLVILNSMENFSILRRSEPLICVGGGVLLDMGGFAASLYRRGIPYIKVPTTLLSIVDASVGVKTSINHFDRRNRIGSYYPPQAAYLDRDFLDTLPEKEITSALGEILKMAVVKNKGLFKLLEVDIEKQISSKFLSGTVAEEIIFTSVDDMIAELKPNLWEKNLKRLVDFGHSFSPLAEMRSLENPDVKSLPHGEAVALDVIFSSCLSHHRNLLSKKELKRIINLARRMKLPVYHKSFCDEILMWEALQDTIKHRDGAQNLPVPIEIGDSIFLNDVEFADIISSVEVYKKETK